MKRIPTLLALATGLALCTGASAQVVITHAKALAGNVTPGDAPGYPVTISQPGSFILKSHLVVPANTTGIDVSTGVAGVHIDLNGFTVAGPGSCTSSVPDGPADQCSGHGNGYGIKSWNDGTTVSNGTIAGFQYGALIDGGEIRHVLFLENLKVGAQQADVGRAFLVVASQFVMNGNAGLVCDRCDVIDSQALRNGGTGFSGAGSQNMQITRSSARKNGAFGFGGAIVRDSASHLNGAGSDRGSITSAGGNVDAAGVF